MHTSARVHFTNERNPRQPTIRNMHLDAHNNSGTLELCIPAVAQMRSQKSHWCQRTSRCPRPTSGHPIQRSSDRSALEPSHASSHHHTNDSCHPPTCGVPGRALPNVEHARMCEASFSCTSLKTTCATVGDHAQASSRPPPMCRTSLMSSHGHSFSTPSGQNSSLRPRSFLYSACIRHLPPGREWSLRSADFPFAPEPSIL